MREKTSYRVVLLVLIPFSLWNGFSLAQENADLASSQFSVTSDTRKIQMILDQVEAMRDEIVSAEIQYRWHLSVYQNESYQNTQNTPEHVKALINEIDVVANTENLERLVRELRPFYEVESPVWESREFVMLGDKRRADTEQGTIQLVDSDHEMTYHLFNEQLTVTGRGGSWVHRTQIEDFRSFPRRDFQAEDFRIEKRENGEITLALIPDELVIARYTLDEATGVMTHEVRFFKGQTKSEVWQRALTEYPGGVTLPMLRMQANYQRGWLNSLTVWTIENANLNGPVDEGRFIMSVPKETVLVDTRLPKTVVRKVKEPVDDVRTILTPISAAGAPSTVSERTNWRVLLILNGLVFILLAVWFWKKGSTNLTTSTSSPPG